jgi:hypothetical protein
MPVPARQASSASSSVASPDRSSARYRVLRIDPEALGGLLLVAAALGEHQRDVALLQLGEGGAIVDDASRGRGSTARDVGGQIGGEDHVPLGDRHRPLDGVLKLAHVPRPGIAAQQLQGLARDAGLGAPLAAGHLARKWFTRMGMSPARSRSGGSFTVTTLMRK